MLFKYQQPTLNTDGKYSNREKGQYVREQNRVATIKGNLGTHLPNMVKPNISIYISSAFLSQI